MSLKQLLNLLIAFTCICSSSVCEDALRTSIAQDYEQRLEKLFVHFHKNPELSFREFETSKRMAKELRDLGYDVTEGVGGTGVVAVMLNGGGPTIMMRADMDGLPIRENSGLPYASTVRQLDMNGVEQPVMHACGHDVHITSMVGAARQMRDLANKWSGTLVLICQPAEEIVSGAAAMLKDGLYERFPKPDYALAFHVAVKIPAGKIAVSTGTTGSSLDSVDIVVRGVGTHGAAPHSGVDPVLVASQIVVSLQSIISRTLAPSKPGVITVGTIHGGSKRNIIGQRVDMELTVRANDFETRELLLDSIDRVSEGVARSLGVPDELLPIVTRSETERTPPNVNDREMTLLVKDVFTSKLGPDRVIDWERKGMGAEDFAYFVQPELGVKGVYFMVGGSPVVDVSEAPPGHSPVFRINPEISIKTGVEAMVTAALKLFESG